MIPPKVDERKIDHNVRPDSMLILHVAQEVVEQEGFADILANVRDRIDEIESLHRTRELTVCSSSSVCFSKAHSLPTGSSKMLIEETILN